MTRYAVLLRGINVGRAKQVPMADLKAVLADLGHTGVTTLLRSGNVVLDADRITAFELERQVEKAVEAEFRITSTVLVRTADEVRAVVDGHPFTDVADNGSRMMAYFLSTDPDPELLAAHDPTALDPERCRLGDKVIYQWCPDGLLAAPQVGGYAEKHLAVSVTARNWNTVVKLAALLDDA